VSARRIDGREESFLRTGEKPVDDAPIPQTHTSDQPVVPPSKTLDVKLQAWFNTVHPLLLSLCQCLTSGTGLQPIKSYC
jgi:hypothetical protein